MSKCDLEKKSVLLWTIMELQQHSKDKPAYTGKDGTRSATFDSTASSIQITRIKQQTKTFTIDVDKSKTIFSFHVPKRIAILGCILYAILYIIEHITNSLIASILTTIVGCILLCTYLSHCNLYVSKQAFKSFTLWYKVIHIAIAIVARQIYENSVKYEYDDIKPNVGYNYILYYFKATIACIGYTLGILVCSLNDSIATKSNTVIRVVGILGIVVYSWVWISVYFSIYDDNVNESFNITIFNHTHTYYWRSMALSSLFKCVVFLCVQLYKNFKVSMICFVFCNCVS